MPISGEILANVLLQKPNKKQWLILDLSIERRNVSFGIRGISIATSPKWIGNATFKLEFKNIDGTTCVMTAEDFKEIPTVDGEFYDIRVTNRPQPGLSVKFLILSYVTT